MSAANRINDDDGLLTEVQTADVLRLSIRTLQAWRVKGIGPAFVQAGRAIRYRRCDVFAWIDLNTVSPKSISSGLTTGEGRG